MGENQRDPMNWVIGVLVLFLAVFSAYQAYVNHQADVKQQDCLVNVVHKQNNALQARSKTANQSDKATRAFLLGVKDVKTEAEFKKLFATYSKAQDKIKAERKAHPYPPYPEGKCD